MTETGSLLDGLNLDDIKLETDIPEQQTDELETGAPKTRLRKRRSDAGVPRTGAAPRSPAGARRTSKLADELLDPWARLAKGLAFVAPTASAVLIERGEVTTRALVQIAEKHPRMLKALQSVGKVGPASDIGETAVMLIIALQVDIGRIPATHPVASVLGVTRLYAQVHPDTPTGVDPLAGVVVSPDGVVIDAPPVQPPPGYYHSTDPHHPMYSFTAGPK